MMNTVLFVCCGLFLTGVLGLFAGWVDRKVTARVQYRVGPPVLQPVWDLLKLSGKETVVPAEASIPVFLAMPLIGLAGVTAVATILWAQVIHPEGSFVGDWIVILYLLLLPPISVIVGGFVSRNPLASLGASRELQLLLGYELPFLLAALVPVIQSGNSIRLGDILHHQANSGPIALTLSGALALLVGILCTQAKLSLIPFDVSEAETEISGGVLIEYSGMPLALYRLARQMLLFLLPFLLMFLFLGGFDMSPLGILAGILKYVVLLAVLIVVRNTNPRLRTDQTLRLFWGPVLVIAVIAVALALNGF